MHQHSPLRQRVLRLVQLEPGFADFHARALSPIQDLRCAAKACRHLIDSISHLLGSRIAAVAFAVTLSASGFLSDAEHLIARRDDSVIAVTLDTLADLHKIEDGLVGARLEEGRLANVALAADVGN